MPTARSIDLVELPVPTVAAVRASTAFFSDAFGWTFVTYGDEYADTADSGLTLGVNGSDPDQKSLAPLAVLYVEDLEATRDAVIASGGTVTRSIYAFPGGRRFHFTEPSGNELAAWSDVDKRE